MDTQMKLFLNVLHIFALFPEMFNCSLKCGYFKPQHQPLYTFSVSSMLHIQFDINSEMAFRPSQNKKNSSFKARLCNFSKILLSEVLQIHQNLLTIIHDQNFYGETIEMFIGIMLTHYYYTILLLRLTCYPQLRVQS